jgi:ferric-dicitrate binding protein FerR (iron transport regulator)
MHPTPNERTCPDPEQLARFMDGSLEESERARTEEHLAGCRTCRETAAAAARALHALGTRATTTASPLPRWAAIAASILLLVAVGWIIRPDPPTNGEIAAVPGPGPDAVNTASGLELAGGFLAASNDSPTSSLCVQADGDTVRWALLRGSLFVELAPKSPPVRVVTPHATVTVPRGEVRILVSPAQTDVQVASGRAVVEGASNGQALTIRRGEAVAAVSKRMPERVERDAPGTAPAWVEAARARHLVDVMTSAFPVAPGGVEESDP